MPKKIVIFFLVTACFLLGTQHSYGQELIRTIDSLWSVYKSEKSDREQISLLNEISYTYRRVSPDSTMKYAYIALSRSQRLGDSEGMAIGYKNMGIAHYKFGSPSDTIVFYYNQAIVYAVLSEDYYTQAACYNNIALINIADLMYNQAIINLLKGVKIFDIHIKKENRLKALMISNLAGAYIEQGEIEKGIAKYELGIAMGDRLGEKSIRSIFVDELARAKMSLDRLEEAKKDIQQVIPLQNELADYESKVDALITLAEINSRQNDFELANKHGQEALALASERGFIRMRVLTLIQLVRIHKRQNNIKEAIRFAEEAEKASKARDYKKLEAEVIYLLSQLYAAQGSFSNAYQYLQEYETLRKDHTTESAKRMRAEQEAKYRVREREVQIENLRQQQQSQRERIRLLLIASLGFLILLLISIYLYLQKSRTTKALNEKNNALELAERELNERNQELKKYIASNLELENFAHLASHDLREPMRTIVSFSQLLERSTKNKLDTTEQEYLTFVQHGIKRIESLVNDLLAFSIVNNTKPTVKPIEVKAVIDQVIFDLQKLIVEKKVHLEINELPLKMKADKSRMYQLFQNLITNAIRYSKKHETPKIRIGSQIEKTHYHFYVADNGIGIDPEHYQHIFLLFKTLHNKSITHSSGIGLATCKKILEQHQGKIWLESTLGQGSTFHFTIAREPRNN
ncbi:MAG: hypothetical protein DHS20C18_53130 [Saprospiraceae bacterium]|nr:MAG: hypothetical protein DHS20C18_53130 [Saprospiraceae bacterium]